MQRVAPSYKDFGGRRYIFSIGVPTKVEAERIARRDRKKGYLARVVTIPNIRGAFIYTRGR